ncbi:MAG: DUF2142 domain-containing protein [Lautropia sp.]|nr:DUF2142 domain-containing protein [Lautropia sp.]
MIPVRTMNSAPEWQRRHEVANIATWAPGAGWLLALAFTLGLLLSLLIPPLKSADEIDHLRRAYFLSQGQWLLHTQPCDGESGSCRNGTTMSGGMLDSGLRDYILLNDPVRRTQESALGEQGSDALQWRGDQVFDTAPGTGYYFPLVYAPQAAGLAIGKAAGLNIDNSYHLARLLAFASGMLVLMLAFFIHRPPVVVLALLLLPMSLFQAMSSSIDFIATALAVLGIACFMRVASQRQQSSLALAVLMAITIFLVGASRAHLASMVLLMFVAAWHARHRLWWILAIVTTVAILAWMAVAIPGVVDFRIERSVTTGQAVAHYLRHPVELLQVLTNTFTDRALLAQYRATFLGVFLDLRLQPLGYLALTVLLGLIALFSLAPPSQWKPLVPARITLIVCGFISALLAFLAMLITWTPVPTQVVQGVQGRYLLISVMMVLVGLSHWGQGTNPIRGILRGLLFIFFSVSAMLSVQTMLSGYYTPLATNKPVPAGQAVSAASPEPSPMISMGSPLQLALAPEGIGSASAEWIGLNAATYGRQLQGKGQLVFSGGEAGPQTVDISLENLADNEYFYVRVPPGRHTHVRLHIVSGSGNFSIWSTRAGEPADELKACAVFVLSEGSIRYTPGCSAPR